MGDKWTHMVLGPTPQRHNRHDTANALRSASRTSFVKQLLIEYYTQLNMTAVAEILNMNLLPAL